MRIAYVITRADEIGGAQVHVRDLATAMSRAGHEVTVIAGRPGPLSDQLMQNRVRFSSVPTLTRELHPVQDPKAFLELKALLAMLRPDLISTHSSKAGWLGRLAAKALAIPVLFTAHGWAFTEGVPRLTRSIYGFAERLAAPLADHIITVSEYDRRLALRKRIAPPEKITRIYNGVFDHAGPRSARPHSGPVRIVMIGRFSPQKDHCTLLRALAGVRHLNWVVELIGGGDRSNAAALAEALGIMHRVRFLGERSDAYETLGSADIYTLVSNWEGLPRSILEAMSMSLPVLATRVGGVAELVRDGETGFLAQRNDIVGLATKLELLISNGDLRFAFGSAGRQRYNDEFRFERMFDNTLATYDRVLARRESRALEPAA